MQATAVSTDQLTDEITGFFAYLMHTGQDTPFQLAADLDLSTSQLRLLFILHHRGESSLHELQQAVGLSVAATGRAVDALVRDDLASRREDPSDRRVKRIALTEHGSDVVQRFAAGRRSGFVEVVSTLTDDERAALSAALAPILARATAVPASACSPKDAP
jgi:DNA-binding MarR family transcriptional regulator